MTNNEIIECLQILLKNIKEVSNEENATVIMDCKPDSFAWVITEAIEALSITTPEEEYENYKLELMERYGLIEGEENV